MLHILCIGLSHAAGPGVPSARSMSPRVVLAVQVVTVQTQVSGHSGPVASWALQGQEKQEVTLPQILWLL